MPAEAKCRREIRILKLVYLRTLLTFKSSTPLCGTVQRHLNSIVRESVSGRSELPLSVFGDVVV